MTLFKGFGGPAGNYTNWLGVPVTRGLGAEQAVAHNALSHVVALHLGGVAPAAAAFRVSFAFDRRKHTARGGEIMLGQRVHLNACATQQPAPVDNLDACHVVEWVLYRELDLVLMAVNRPTADAAAAGARVEELQPGNPMDVDSQSSTQSAAAASSASAAGDCSGCNKSGDDSGSNGGGKGDGAGADGGRRSGSSDGPGADSEAAECLESL
ncbi:hypothetical protein JKP88DRAFT_278741 [Tribonema minus]|uniref:Uncharacterized protein n=1 Tax=Tribonema minus TaxID=303371 RepID=A0A835YUF1_9STRA|nr:hypothetical protein JKP88DRAFT_278741 [Tribonema minus]